MNPTGFLSVRSPGVEVPYVDYGKLQLAIERQLDLAGLQRVDSLITKIIQVREGVVFRQFVGMTLRAL